MAKLWKGIDKLRKKCLLEICSFLFHFGENRKKKTERNFRNIIVRIDMISA